ncbi:MAG: hypothetical protein ACTHN5_04185 [Phycisphaerae bacterium]
MREFLNKNGKYVAAAVLVLAGVIFYFTSRGGEKKPETAFYFDEDTGTEVIRPVTDVPPQIGAKGNPSVVKVYKYRVAGSPDVKVGYYFKFTPEMKAKVEDSLVHPEKYPDLNTSTGMLVRKPDAGPSGWVEATSAEGKKILEGDPNEGPRDTVYP